MLDSAAGGRAFRSDAAHHDLTVDLLQICAEPRPRRRRPAKRGIRDFPQDAPGAAAVRASAGLSVAAGEMPGGLRRAMK
jgi:hypothetical protein